MDIEKNRVLLGNSVETVTRMQLSYAAYGEFSSEGACYDSLDAVKEVVRMQSCHFLENALHEGREIGKITLYDVFGRPEHIVYIVDFNSDFDNFSKEFNSMAKQRMREGKHLQITELRYFPLKSLMKAAVSNNLYDFTVKGKTVKKHIALCEENVVQCINSKTCQVLCGLHDDFKTHTHK